MKMNKHVIVIIIIILPADDHGFSLTPVIYWAFLN